jgi:ketosteroid isomerase-like protein
VDVARLREFLAAFNRHDLDAIMSFFTDDCVFEMPRGPAPTGTRAVRRADVHYCGGREANPPSSRERRRPLEYGDDRHFVAGDRGTSEWLLTGTTLSGQRIAVRGCDLFEFRGDRVVRKDSYWKIVEGG